MEPPVSAGDQAPREPTLGPPAAQRRCPSAPGGPSTQWATAGAPEAPCGKEWWARQAKGPPTGRTKARSRSSVNHPGHHAGTHATCENHDVAHTTCEEHATRNPQGTRRAHTRPAEWGSVCGGRPGQCVEEQSTWASRTRKRSEADCGRPEDGGVWTATTVTQAPQQPAQPPIRQLLGAADAQMAHHATSHTAPAHQPLGSANAETTPAGAPAAAADTKQWPNAACGGKNG